MERLWLWADCFACSPLPHTSEHPCSSASYKWKYWLRELGRGCTMEEVLDGGMAQASSQNHRWTHKPQ